MSKRECEEHGALSIEWDTEDIPDEDDGSSKCYVCELEDQGYKSKQLIQNLNVQISLLAMLSADTPQFNNPLLAMKAKQIRDEILKKDVI